MKQTILLLHGIHITFMGIKTVITSYPKRQNKNINERNV